MMIGQRLFIDISFRIFLQLGRYYSVHLVPNFTFLKRCFKRDVQSTSLMYTKTDCSLSHTCAYRTNNFREFFEFRQMTLIVLEVFQLTCTGQLKLPSGSYQPLTIGNFCWSCTALSRFKNLKSSGTYCNVIHTYCHIPVLCMAMYVVFIFLDVNLEIILDVIYITGTDCRCYKSAT